MKDTFCEEKNAMSEQWRDIAGFEGRYQISSYGRVMSLGRCWRVARADVCIAQKMMSLQVHYRGYLFVHLRKPGVHKKEFIHRLVGAAFLPNPDQKDVVNHKDRNKSNNVVSNLEWATYIENSHHWMALEKKDEIPF